jgi:hypothetical protein
MPRKKKKNNDNYFGTLELSGKTLKSEGKNIQEVFDNFGIEWYNIKSKGAITIKYKDKEFMKLLYMKQLKRLFANKLGKNQWVKNFESLFNF